MLLIATLTCDFLSAFDLSAVSTTLPTIVNQLNGTDFIWAGSAYPLAATALIPLCGGLVSIFGRKPVLLFSVILFAAGSAICGAAHNLNMLIAGRTVQGLGSGGCLATTEIIYADLSSILNAHSATGPIVGGALAHGNVWRWLFYLNLPISGVALALIIYFYRVPSPKFSFREKVAKMDWIGAIIVVGGSASLTLALTWGGIQFAWSAPQTLVPLIVGIVALIAFFFVERFVSAEPIIPWSVVNNRTSLSGYLGTGVHGIVSFGAIYYLPVYFQSVKGASPVRSGVDILAMVCFIAPSCIGVGISVEISRRYRPQNYIGWALTIAGFGILTLLDDNSSKARYVCSQFVLGIGLGIIWIATQFPILAPLPYSNNAHALAFFTFVRCMTQNWGIAIGGAILQNQLQAKLPSALIDSLPSGAAFAYSLIPAIKDLSPPLLQDEVRHAFADSLKLIWETMAGISGLGLLSCLLMKEVDMRTDVDEQWALEGKEKKPAVEGEA
ncbi:iron permease [Epithele typhae]|uniref:iron permease n=1 Tax=Epithele typhae TaxID=378194 RepID=UPI00200833FF|nr:iron permease [Epithele typhae]KAH9944243.1 iron permease [Epithele typhae]